ncbi:YgaP family membrane protein [Wohlfahrtiimonas larvae]|uniref:DUF2892 domain-containing protein n=1 Tax=Wohlfahrtiimonas larvae TaxID=1157986 RepID=A0ABP9MK06_9GAMM|nr:DUF2892 domain-containing protein [Wohlfahrtiimonas larvae]
MMKKNIGTTDMVIRFIVGLFLLSLIFWGPKTLWGLVGLVPILAGAIRFCPFYTLFGINTCKKD